MELRAALSDYLSRVRGVSVTPDRIVVCSGFTQALGLVLSAQRERGVHRVAMEGYGLPLHRDVAIAQRMRVQTLAVDGDGAIVDRLSGAGTVLLTPAHQFPLGVALAPDRRRRVVEWAADHGGLVIEDDYDGEFRYDRQSVGALQALAPDRIVYAGTASKALAPGLRLAWLAVPPPLAGGVVEAKRIADGHSGTFDQLTLAELLRTGSYERHVRRCRLAYQRRRNSVVETVRRRVPDARITGIAAGLHALVELPPGRGEAETVARAAALGLAVEGLASYRTGDQKHRPALVIGYATPPEHAFAASLDRLCAVIGESTRRRPAGSLGR